MPPTHDQLRVMTPIVKARMRQPRVHRNGELTLTYDGGVGFVLEDEGKARNVTIQAGSPFQTTRTREEDLLDLIGLVMMVPRMIDDENSRNVAILAYYADHPTFALVARYEGGERVEFDHDG